MADIDKLNIDSIIQRLLEGERRAGGRRAGAGGDQAPVGAGPSRKPLGSGRAQSPGLGTLSSYHPLPLLSHPHHLESKDPSV